MPKTKHDPEAVDAYLASLPDAERAALEDLRLLIKNTVPDVQERISYGTSVIFAVKRDLVGFVAQEKHLSFFTMSPELARSMRGEIHPQRVRGYDPFQAPMTRCRDRSSEILRARLKEEVDT